MCIWDLSGNVEFRPIWKNYVDDVNGLIFMIDAANEDVEGSIGLFSKLLLNVIRWGNGEFLSSEFQCADIDFDK